MSDKPLLTDDEIERTVKNMTWRGDGSTTGAMRLGMQVARGKYEDELSTLRARITELEQWESVGMGETVMCACGEPQCYHAIEFIENDLLVYEDISDESEGAIVVQLPPGWRIQRRKEADNE